MRQLPKEQFLQFSADHMLFILFGVFLASLLLAGCTPQAYDRVGTTIKYTELKCHLVGISQGVPVDYPLHIETNGNIAVPFAAMYPLGQNIEPKQGDHLNVECDQHGELT